MQHNMTRLSLFSLSLLISLLVALPSQAASIKERMAARIPAINSLKDQGAVGENNKGFLEYRIGSKPQQQVVSEENKDRTTVYKKIAKQQGASAALVGKRRAKMIADKGKKGHWHQKPDGSWYKK